MTDESSSRRERRGLAAAFASCGLAMLLLLAKHPDDGARNFTDFIKSEAHNQFIDGLVHGGFILTLAALIVCFVLLARHLGSARVPVVIALVAFFLGSGALMASMVLDGFATPAIAARFADTGSAEDLSAAKTLLILIGTLIRFLMPLGLLLQSASMVGWSWAIMRAGGLPRAVGGFGLTTAVSLIVALLAAPPALAMHVLLGGILLQAVWYFVLAAALFGNWLAGPSDTAPEGHGLSANRIQPDHTP